MIKDLIWDINTLPSEILLQIYQMQLKESPADQNTIFALGIAVGKAIAIEDKAGFRPLEKVLRPLEERIAQAKKLNEVNLSNLPGVYTGENSCPNSPSGFHMVDVMIVPEGFCIYCRKPIPEVKL